MNRYKINGYERINKRAAFSAYMRGETVIVSACNLRLFTVWNPGYYLNRKSREQFVVDDIGTKNDFYNIISSFEYYNCTCAETGKYAAFYVKEGAEK